MSHFISLPTTVSAQDLARIFLREISKLHGLLTDIVSDRDTKFTFKFWSALMDLLDVKQRLSTAFHPETDGQTERVNQSLEQYLRMFSNYEQNNWSGLLLMVEFAFNNSVISVTDLFPFYTNYEYHLETHWLVPRTFQNLAVGTYAHWLREVYQQCLE